MLNETFLVYDYDKAHTRASLRALQTDQENIGVSLKQFVINYIN